MSKNGKDTESRPVDGMVTPAEEPNTEKSVSGGPKSKTLNEQERDLRGVLDEVISEAGDSTPNAPVTSSAEDAQKELRDEALFRSIAKKKKKKRNRIIRTVVILLVIFGGAGYYGVSYLRHKVQVKSVSGLEDVTSYAASIGSISTTVTGTGTLSNVDEEKISVPDGVEIEDVVVEVNDKVEKGDIIAELDMSTVRSTIATVQSEIEDLDAKIYDAASETVSTNLNAGLGGRVKEIYAKKGDAVYDCMVENGALAVLSLDGKMALKLEHTGLAVNDTVKVLRSGSEKKLEGTVESVVGDTAVILVTDNGPEAGELVSVETADGRSLGSGELYIHKPLRVTGIAGRIQYVNVSLNQGVSKGDAIFILNETGYSATYESLLKERSEKEEKLLRLMQLNRDGALLAPFSGSIGSVLYDDGDEKKEDTSAASSSQTSQYGAFGMMAAYSAGGMMSGASAASSAAAGTSSQTSEKAAGEDTDVVRLSPDELMEISISVDESNILDLKVGQSASVSVSSIGDETFTGILTEIDKTANSSSGVTRYSAVISVKKDDRMLPGMSARAVVRIQGIDDAVIIPVEALHQTSSTSFVYTSYDPELAEYGGLVRVTAGISNSSYVEITEGLKEGDVVYYVEAENDLFGFAMGGGRGGPSGHGGR